MNRRAAKPDSPSAERPDTIEESMARGRADAEAGRVVPHAIVREWLSRWAEGDPGHTPKSGK